MSLQFRLWKFGLFRFKTLDHWSLNNEESNIKVLKVGHWSTILWVAAILLQQFDFNDSQESRLK
jgi:hypothetical protein